MRLRTAADQAVLFARQHVRQAIPDEVVFLVYPNQSCDDNQRVGDEVVFPDESLPDGKYLGPWTAEEVVAFLWREGKVPEWIDMAVEKEECHRSLVGLRCSTARRSWKRKAHRARTEPRPLGSGIDTRSRTGTVRIVVEEAKGGLQNAIEIPSAHGRFQFSLQRRRG